MTWWRLRGLDSRSTATDASLSVPRSESTSALLSPDAWRAPGVARRFLLDDFLLELLLELLLALLVELESELDETDEDDFASIFDIALLFYWSKPVILCFCLLGGCGSATFDATINSKPKMIRVLYALALAYTTTASTFRSVSIAREPLAPVRSANSFTAQCAQDFVVGERLLGGVHGYYVDLAAHQPICAWRCLFWTSLALVFNLSKTATPINILVKNILCRHQQYISSWSCFALERIVHWAWSWFSLFARKAPHVWSCAQVSRLLVNFNWFVVNFNWFVVNCLLFQYACRNTKLTVLLVKLSMVQAQSNSISIVTLRWYLYLYCFVLFDDLNPTILIFLQKKIEWNS